MDYEHPTFTMYLFICGQIPAWHKQNGHRHITLPLPLDLLLPTVGGALLGKTLFSLGVAQLVEGKYKSIGNCLVSRMGELENEANTEENRDKK